VYGLINYDTLIVQAVEILNGGEMGNVTINATVCHGKLLQYTLFKFIPSLFSSLTSPVENSFSSTLPPIQVPAEGIIQCHVFRLHTL
jgi:uncharacterized protein YdgA (DUF945 family)